MVNPLVRITTFICHRRRLAMVIMNAQVELNRISKRGLGCSVQLVNGPIHLWSGCYFDHAEWTLSLSLCTDADDILIPPIEIVGILQQNVCTSSLSVSLNLSFPLIEIESNVYV